MGCNQKPQVAWKFHTIADWSCSIRTKCCVYRSQIHVGKFAADEEDPGCVDAEAECETWAFGGECKANPKFMLKRCRRSCDACDPPPAGGPDPSLGTLDWLTWVRVSVRVRVRVRVSGRLEKQLAAEASSMSARMFSLRPFQLTGDFCRSQATQRLTAP